MKRNGERKKVSKNGCIYGSFVVKYKVISET